MRTYKNDSICSKCGWSSEFNRHKCHYTVSTGTYFKPAVSGRRGLSKDGCSCKYFSPKKKNNRIVMKVYYPNKEFGQYVPIEQNILVLWKIHTISDFFKHLKRCYFSKKKCQSFCDWKNAPEIDFGGVLQIGALQVID